MKSIDIRRKSLDYDRLEECRAVSPIFNMLFNSSPATDFTSPYGYGSDGYKAMSLWSLALADAAEEAGFDDVAEYERWWADDWLDMSNKPTELGG